MTVKKNVCIDVCCGPGGLSYGFMKAGFDVVLGLDINEEVLQTYKNNLPSSKVLVTDVLQVGKAEILQNLSNRRLKIDGILASPPCRGFSQSNRRSRNLENPSNLLYLEILRLIGDFRPTWFLIENVWGLKHLAGGHVENHIIQMGTSMGYQVSTEILNAVEYGVPQKRRRIFFIGFLNKRRFVFPKPNRSSSVTVREAIGDLPSLSNGDTSYVLPYKLSGDNLSEFQLKMRGRKGSQFVSGNIVTRNNKTVLSRYKHIPPGGNWKNIPLELMSNYKDPSQCHTGIYRRLEWDAPSVVISNFRKNMLIHPEENRGLSVREAARLQSFPDSFVFEGCLGSQQQQVADAVPPLLAQILARQIKRFLN